MSKNRHFQTICLLKRALLLALTGKSEFYYSDKISEGRIKQISRENGLLFSDPIYTCKSLIKLLSGHRSQVQHFFEGGGHFIEAKALSII